MVRDDESESSDPFDGDPLLDQFLNAAEQWVSLERTGEDATEQLNALRTLGKLIFPAPDRTDC